MSKKISMEKFDKKFAETIDFEIESSVCINSSKTEGTMYIGGKRCRITEKLFMAISPNGDVDMLNPDDIAFAIKPKYDKDFTAFFSYAGENHKFSWKHPYDLPYIFVGVFKSSKIIVYVTMSTPQSSGNLSGVFMDFGYKGPSYQKVLELVSSELSTVTTLSKSTDRYDFEKFLSNESHFSTTDAIYPTEEGNEYED